MNRRVFLQSAGGSAFATVAGCSGELPDPDLPDLRAVNYDDVAHTLSVTIQRENSSSLALDRTFELPAGSTDRIVERVFDQPGTYEVTAILDEGTAKTFTWTIEEPPVSGGFRLVIEKRGTLYDDTVGSP